MEYEDCAYNTFKQVTLKLAQQLAQGLLTELDFDFYWTMALVKYNSEVLAETTI